MKARVLKNGRIVNIYPKEAADYAGRLKYIEKGKGLSYYEDELDFIDYSDEPDYWEKLKHQATIAAMQGLISRAILDTPDSLSSHAIHYATALVNRLKEDKK